MKNHQMGEKSETIESIIQKLYKDFPDEGVDEILNNASIKIMNKEFEKMDNSIKKMDERLDFSKKSPEERKKIAFGIYIQKLIEQIQQDKE